MVTVYTHVRPDLDAVASVWAAKSFIAVEDEINIELVKSGIDEDELNDVMDDEDIAVDIDGGIKGDKFSKSAFQEIIFRHAPNEVNEALYPLRNYVESQDSTGMADAQHDLPDGFPSLNVIINSLGRASEDGVEQIRRAFPILDGYLEGALEYKRAEEAAEKAEFVGDVAIAPEDADGPVNKILYEDHDAQAVIFQDGNNLGVVRRNDIEINIGHGPVYYLIRDHGDFDSWFFHEDGFLVAHGTRKSPAEKPPQISAEELAEAANECLHKFENMEV